MQPVILLGTERSGTNLLRRFLNAHQEIASPPPSGLISPMAKCSHLYLDHRAGKDAMAHWVQVALALIEAHPADWGMVISADDVLPRINGRSHWDLFRAFNELYAERHRASIWVSKEPEAIYFLTEIAAHLADAKFVYLVRDGRDVAASMLKGGVHDRHIYGVARRWYRDQEAGIRLLEDTSVQERTYLIRYEDFIADHKTEIAKLLAFLGCSMDEEILQSHTNESVEKLASHSELWRNVGQPVRADNHGKYRKNLKASEIAVFEAVTRDKLTYFGYRPDTEQHGTSVIPSRLQIKIETLFGIAGRYLDETVRRENRLRRKFRSVARKVMAGKPFGTFEASTRRK